MILRKIYRTLILLMFIFPVIANAQEKFTINGTVKDAQTGEDLLYASIYVIGKNLGCITNNYGFYSLKIPSGKFTISYSYLGYDTKNLDVDLNKDLKINIELETKGKEIDEIVVTARKENANVTTPEMSTVSLDMKQSKTIPVLFGEQDILKTIQLKPGVSASSEGSSGFFVRGGEADQNHLLLDEAPVYNASHLMGFFSVFNSDAIKDVKLYKGSIPAKYGGRVSSVMDIRMKEGNMKEWSGSGGIGLISSRLALEGPIKKDKGSLIISGRRTYADLLLRSASKDFKNTSLYFYDLNLKANYTFGENDRVYFSGYFGRDVFGMEDFGFDWGNKTLTTRWNHIFNDELFSNTSIIYSDYNYGFKVENSGDLIELSSGIYDYNAKQDYTWFLNHENTLNFGWNSTYHKFKPANFSSGEDNNASFVTVTIPDQQALENGLYISNEQKLGEKLNLNYGVRLSTFSNIGPYQVKEYTESGDIVKSKEYEKGDFYNTYFGLEPRFSASYVFNKNTSFKASYNRNIQYLHLLSNSNSGSPTDLWTPTTPTIEPTKAGQVAIGFFRNLKNGWNLSIETYYKYMQNLVDYKNGADAFMNRDVEAELVFGTGRAYGAELLLNKNTGKLTGWLSYTLSKSEKQFDAINAGSWFSSRQDRTHDISVVAQYKISGKLTLSGNWIYYTGDAVTYPNGKYLIDGAVTYLYSGRNNQRMPDYHRLDLGLTLKLKDKKKFKSDLNFSVYNAYRRKNAYSITLQESEDVPGTTEAVKLSLFRAIPSISWNFRF